MKIEIHVKEKQIAETPKYDLTLSECKSLKEVTESIAVGIDLKRILHIELKPPLPAGLSIPNAFQAIVVTLQQYSDEDIMVHVYVQSELVADHLMRYYPNDLSPVKKWSLGEADLIVRLGNIAFAEADAIVNASNTLLKLGAGVSGAIANAAQPGLQEEMYAIARTRDLAEGDAAVTSSFGLPCKYIIHVATARGEAIAVRQAIRNVFSVCTYLKLCSLAIPALGTGTGGLPIFTFANIAADEVQRLRKPEYPLKRVEFVLWVKSDFDCLTQTFSEQLDL